MPRRTERGLDLLEDYLECDVLEFGPVKLEAARSCLMDGKHTAQYIRENTRFIINMFKLAVQREIVPASVPYALETIETVKGNDARVKESKKRVAVLLDVVMETAAYMHPTLYDMVRLQIYTGMRPSELFKMKACCIDTSGDYWTYIPGMHKNSWRGGDFDRFIMIGKHAQDILLIYLAGRGQNEYLFVPEEAVQKWEEKKHSERKTPMNCGNKPGSNKKGTRKLNECYDKDSYRKAIVSALSRLNKAKDISEYLDKEKTVKNPKYIHWTPYQLRHTSASLLNVVENDEAITLAQAMLGHKHISTTEIYKKIGIEKGKAAVNIIEREISKVLK